MNAQILPLAVMDYKHRVELRVELVGVRSSALLACIHVNVLASGCGVLNPGLFRSVSEAIDRLRQQDRQKAESDRWCSVLTRCCGVCYGVELMMQNSHGVVGHEAAELSFSRIGFSFRRFYRYRHRSRSKV